MPLQLNLLHEEILEQRQRQRDPLKISMMIAIGATALMALNYLWGGYKVLSLKSQLSSAEREWKKVEPLVTRAQKRADELNAITSSTNALDRMIDGRFYWAEVLEKIARCVTPNMQLISLDGGSEEGKGVQLNLEGITAGREPRAVAEDFRQMLIEQIGKNYPGSKIEFKGLEDLETTANVGGAVVPTARFVLLVTFDSSPKTAEKPAAPARRKRETKDE